MKYSPRIHPLLRTVTAVLIAASTMLATSIGSEASTGGYRTIWVPLYRQIYGLDCEAAAVQMALAHERIRVSQNALLNAMQVDRRAPTRDAAGFHWGNPNTNFVGNPNGSERLQTGYGTYADPASRAARTTSSKLASGLVAAIVSRIVPRNRKFSCSTTPMLDLK